MGRMRALVMAVMIMTAAASALAADPTQRLDAARAALARNDLARAARELEAALTDLQDRLGKSLIEALPPALSGWKAENPEFQSLSQAGGGFSLTRAYEKGDASLNASLIVDSPAALGSNPGGTPQPGQKKVKIGNEEALLRFDPQARNGELVILLSNRVVLEITGDNLSSADPLTDLGKGWNLGKIRSALAL